MDYNLSFRHLYKQQLVEYQVLNSNLLLKFCPIFSCVVLQKSFHCYKN
jgi:hypothetical protein